MNVAAGDLMRSLVRSSLNARMQFYINKTDLQMSEECKDSVENSESEMSVIMLWGVLGSVTLKLYFDIDKAIKLTALALNTPVSDVQPKMARAFMTEFSNNQGGYLKGFLETRGIMTSMSLPMLADGADEATLKKIRDPRAMLDQGCICIDGMEFRFTSEICLLDPAPVLAGSSRIQEEIDSNYSSQKLEDSGEVSFF